MAKKEKKENKKVAMTLRYDVEQEAEILDMMKAMGEKTMSKAFLSAPKLLRIGANKLIEKQRKIEQQQAEITELRSVLSAWQQFNTKLESFVNKKG